MDAITATSSLAAAAAAAGSRSKTEKVAEYYQWHVLGDVFLIWHRGPFATINGFRLGRSAIRTAGCAEKYAGAAASTATAETNANSCGYFVLNGSTTTTARTTLGLSGGGNGTITTTAAATTTTSTAMIEQQKKVVVPWNEINSALGQVLFLMYTLQQNTPNSGIKFMYHILQPCGGTSKIGVLKNKQQQQRQQQQTSSSNNNNEQRRITALAAYNANSSSSSSNSSSCSNIMSDNNTTVSTFSNSSSSSNKFSLP